MKQPNRSNSPTRAGVRPSKPPPRTRVGKPPKKQKVPRTWKEVFLAELVRYPNVSHACRVAGVSRFTAYAHRKSDQAFAQDWDDADAEATDLLEQHCFQRATTGTLRPVYQGGKKVGEVREYSDSIAIVLLKALKPEKYGNRVVAAMATREMTVEETAAAFRIAEDGLIRTIRASIGYSAQP